MHKDWNGQTSFYIEYSATFKRWYAWRSKTSPDDERGDGATKWAAIRDLCQLLINNDVRSHAQGE